MVTKRLLCWVCNTWERIFEMAWSESCNPWRNKLLYKDNEKTNLVLLFFIKSNDNYRIMPRLNIYFLGVQYFLYFSLKSSHLVPEYGIIIKYKNPSPTFPPETAPDHCLRIATPLSQSRLLQTLKNFQIVVSLFDLTPFFLPFLIVEHHLHPKEVLIYELVQKKIDRHTKIHC